MYHRGDAPPAGDPVAMRSFATQLRKESELLSARAAWLDRRAGRLKFEGPAADELSQTMLRSRRAAERGAGDLREIANRVLSAAARVETDLDHWERARGVG
ncbi:MAG: hypothetical protein KY391_06760 [Actinobacteria bacterium]|nr:hypothetical protein [Actinomycetota bacterium]